MGLRISSENSGSETSTVWRQLSSALRQPEALLEAIRAEKARRRMIDFTHYTNPLYRSAWFHRRLCEILDIFLRGGPRPDNGKPLTRLLVIMPPQHGKSELVSRRLPAMALGLNPHEKILTASYNSGLAADMNRDVQRIIDSPEYHRLFPRTTLDGSGFAPKVSGSWARNSEHFDIVGARGYYKCAGVGGGLTGKTATMGIS